MSIESKANIYVPFTVALFLDSTSCCELCQYIDRVVADIVCLQFGKVFPDEFLTYPL